MLPLNLKKKKKKKKIGKTDVMPRNMNLTEKYFFTSLNQNEVIHAFFVVILSFVVLNNIL